MTPEEKQLLLIDLCARLPYNDYKVQIKEEEDDIPRISKLVLSYIDDIKYYSIASIKVYLRPMSLMTEEEENEYYALEELSRKKSNHGIDILDWLNFHYFDYRGLIEKGLAIEVTEENNPYNIN